VSDWKVVWRSKTRGNGNGEGPTKPTKKAAFTYARALMRDGHEVIKIIGPNDQVIEREEIVRWLEANPE
jgi:hypothetical protein